jgi:hypothetical protein
MHTGFSLGGYLAAASLLIESSQKIRKKYVINLINMIKKNAHIAKEKLTT